MSMLQYKRNGFYVEVGGYDSKSLSNTYALETDYGWRGFALEIDKNKANKYTKERINPCIAADAITFDYEKAFKEFNAPKQIDYLQLDIEPAPNTLACLYKIPMNYRYSVITFEHDLYVDSVKHAVIKNSAKEYLQGFGYKLIVSNVYAPKNSPSPFEDWFVDPNVVSEDIYNNFISENIRPKELFS
jgi:hypothetical protein